MAEVLTYLLAGAAAALSWRAWQWLRAATPPMAGPIPAPPPRRRREFTVWARGFDVAP